MAPTDPPPSDTRLKRLRYQSWHRGTRETDLLLGGFADAHLAQLTPAQLDLFEALLSVPDVDLYDWLTGRAPPDGAYDHDVFAMIRSFNVVPVSGAPKQS